MAKSGKYTGATNHVVIRRAELRGAGDTPSHGMNSQESSKNEENNSDETPILPLPAPMTGNPSKKASRASSSVRSTGTRGRKVSPKNTDQDSSVDF